MDNIKITAEAGKVVTIDIEGLIGSPGDGEATYEKLKDKLAAASGREIVVNIRSTGGSVADALLIYEALSASGAAITTRCWGYVASAATIVAQAASPGRREMSANALYLIHKSVSATQGNENQITEAAELLNKTDQRIASIYAGRSGRETGHFIALMNENNGNGRWMTAEEAMEASLVDRIIAAAPISNSARGEIDAMGLPPIPKNKKTMTITEKWNAIRQIILGSEEDPERLPENEASGLLEQIEKLQNRIEELESQNAKAQAEPTKTKSTEDRSLSDPKRSANQLAYMSDARNFR